MAHKPVPPNPLPRHHRARVETAMIKRREKQYLHDQLWTGQKRYYETWEKNNAKFDDWTSPRYHETHNKLIEKMKKDRDKEESLTKRREKLRKLLIEEEQLYQVEMMIHKTRNAKYPRSRRCDEVPTDVLKELNIGLKVEEEDRRRHEAELKLYHQWRSGNPVLKHYERMQKSRELKLSWLDQQIENRMKKEREEEECRKLLQEREEMLKIEDQKLEEEQKKIQQQKEQLKESLEQQIEQLKAKTQLSEELQRKEQDDNEKKTQLALLELKRIEEEKLAKNKECALYNIKQHKMRLKKKAELIQTELDQEKDLILKLQKLEVADRIQDDAKKNEVKEALRQFLVLNEEQKRLEKTRQDHLDFLFDSEAKVQFEKQNEFWKREDEARKMLIREVMETIKIQIDANLERNRKEQLEAVKEREEMLRKIEEYNREMTELNEREEARKRERKKMIDDDVLMKNLRKKARENAELRRIDDELERVRKEEERLKEEIMKIQRRQGPIRPTRSKLFL